MTNALNAAVENRVLDYIFTELLGLDDQSVLMGDEYKNSKKARSVHTKGTIVEALINEVKNDLGYDVRVMFVEKLWDEYFETCGIPFEHFKTPNPVGELNDLLMNNMGHGEHVVYAYVQEDGK